MRSICLCDRVLATDDWNWYYTLSRQQISKETIQKVILGILNRTRIANNALLLSVGSKKLWENHCPHSQDYFSVCRFHHKETSTIIVYWAVSLCCAIGPSNNMHPYINCAKACTRLYLLLWYDACYVLLYFATLG